MSADRLAGIVGTVVMAALAAWAQWNGGQEVASSRDACGEAVQQLVRIAADCTERCEGE